MKLADALAAAAALAVDRLDAQLLMLHLLGRPASQRGWLLAHDDEEMPGGTLESFLQLCRRRIDGEPLAYIVGSREFFGLELKVDPRVLVPRPETETLVEWALEIVPSGPVRVVDLGTGSGAVALAIKKHRPAASVDGIDSSEDALAVARGNAAALALDVGFRHGCWLSGAVTPYQFIVSNPPYVAEGDPHLPALSHEPRSALTAGVDGLADLRCIVQQAPACLSPGGWLLLEHGWDQAPPVRALLAQAGFHGIASRRDLGGIERCSGGRRPELG